MRTALDAAPIPHLPGRRRVLILDDHDFFAAGLRALLDNESDLVVCDVATHPAGMQERIERLRPDLLVVDLTLGTDSGLEVGRRLRAMAIGTPILFVSTLRAPSREQLNAVERSAFIAKGRTPAQFLAALRAIFEPGEPAAAPAAGGLVLAAALAKG